MKVVPIITNFKRPIRHLIKLILYENGVKLLKFTRGLRSLKCKILFIDTWNEFIDGMVRFWLLIPEMNLSRKVTEWLISFSMVNLMLGCLSFKKFKKIKPLRFIKAHEDVSKDRSYRRNHGYSINLIIKLTVKT